MNSWLYLILTILVGHYIFDCIITSLNLKALNPEVPEELIGLYDTEEYRNSQNYTRQTSRLSLIEAGTTTFITLLFILCSGFNAVDLFVRNFGYGEVITGLLFIGVLTLLSVTINIPFSVYSTFVIEERFGFNQTTGKTFILDTIKATLLAIVIGGPILALILGFFHYTGTYAWLYCWAGVVLITMLLQYLAPVLIMPLFNTFIPLEEGEQQERILTYMKKENFKTQGLFVMDGSKRSSKLNAFFTGFGRFKKIVFYDTLLEKLSTDEIIAVLAHELGHFRKRHIIKMMFISVIQTGILFFLLSLFLKFNEISTAFLMEHHSIHGSLIFFTLLFTPISQVIGLFLNMISRRHEFEADHFAATTTNTPQHLISSLKKLSRENLSNLTPHPLYIAMHYSHPSLLQRIEALNLSKEQI